METHWLVELPRDQDIEKAKEALIHGKIIKTYYVASDRKIMITVVKEVKKT